MTRTELLAQADRHLEAAKFDPVELERLRKQTLLGLFKMKEIRIPNLNA